MPPDSLDTLLSCFSLRGGTSHGICAASNSIIEKRLNEGQISWTDFEDNLIPCIESQPGLCDKEEDLGIQNTLHRYKKGAYH